MSRTGTPQGPAGLFATSRRGGLTAEELRMVEALRARERPVSWQNIAARMGRCEADVRASIEGRSDFAPPYDSWFFGDCDDEIKTIIKDVASRHGVSLKALAQSERSKEVWNAARDCYLAIHDARPEMQITVIARIMKRDKAVVWQGLALAKGERDYLTHEQRKAA